MPLTDVLDEQVYKQRGLAHAAHAYYIDVFGGVENGLLAGDRISSNGNIHSLVRVPAPSGRGLHGERAGSRTECWNLQPRAVKRDCQKCSN